MRPISDVAEFKTALAGMVMATAATGQTAVGAPIDTLGFSDVMAVLSIGYCTGTNAATGTVNVKFQEADDLDDVTTEWSDIQDGTINGTMAFVAAAVLGNTTFLYQQKLYERLDGASVAGVGRKRYIRPVATVAVTANNIIQMPITVGVLLGLASNSENIGVATTVGTGPEYSVGAYYNSFA